MTKLRSFIPKPRFTVVLAAQLLILVLTPIVQREAHPALTRM